jgi:hypothetical protein
MEPGKPDAGKPPVRFDEGRENRRSLAFAYQSVVLLPTLHTIKIFLSKILSSSEMCNDLLSEKMC